ncbi:IS3 family transposase [Streptomyces sp. MNU89]|uniref:IS3 family transposase n=1 Tax=Streptomyces sp. MNU89 TaxID=2560025 RepID=UPI001E614C49|nr:IS3 family transposase [Streptomyces sp. MNU89]MCC9740357.1 IS3 family transposase [Streptomyces sp. MNU89]
MTVHSFTEAEKTADHSVKRACELLKASRAAFYARRNGGPGPRAIRDAELTEQIVAVHERSRGTYGAPRVHVVLKRQGQECGRRMSARLMRQADCPAGRRRPSVPLPPVPTAMPDCLRLTVKTVQADELNAR